MFEGINSNARLLIVVLVMAISAVLFTYWKFDTVAAIGISIVIFLVLIITRPLWAPSGATRVRLLSLTGIFAIGASYGIWAPFADEFIKGITQSPDRIEKYPWLKNVSINSEPSLIMLVFLLGGVFIVNFFMAKDETLTGKHPDPIEKEFPEIGYHKKLKAFANHLRNRLRNLDRESNWSPEYYTELDADVEVRSSTNSIADRRMINLLSAIRSDKKSQGFLVLGDPGAGKSVALRKLSLKMLEEVHKTKRVPIYVNLREWMPKQDENGNQAWSETNKPTVKDLYEFVVAIVIADDDVFTEDFVNAYFKRMWEHGRLFFILDSFDEIPQLLDEGEDSWLNDHLSGLIWTLIAENPNSRGLLASRFFRRPTDAFQASKTLEIRPLSEEKIIHGLDRFPRFGNELQRQLFRERQDLVPIARNPFLMTLLGVWVQEHNSLPDNQTQIYNSYLQGRLTLCQRKLTEKGLSTDDMLTAATTIAWFLFESKLYGLEAPISIIAECAGIKDAEAIMDILVYGRIGRIGAGEKKAFAFVHRRFLEYLAVQNLITSPEQAPIDDIPTDSRGRDALVLYVQIADTKEAERLACYCWKQIQENFENKTTRLRAVHCIRFLSDAFRARKESIRSFQDELVEFIAKRVNKGNDDLLITKLCLEATGLLPQIQAEPILKDAISCGNEWLQETAVKACRYMPQISKELNDALKLYIWKISIPIFWTNRKNLIFSLSLSHIFSDVLKTIKIRTLDTMLLFTGLMFAIFFWPFYSFGILIILLIRVAVGIGELDKLTDRSNLMNAYFVCYFAIGLIDKYIFTGELNNATPPESTCYKCIIVTALVIPWGKINLTTRAFQKFWQLFSFEILKDILGGFLLMMTISLILIIPIGLAFWLIQTYAPNWLQNELKVIMPFIYFIPIFFSFISSAIINYKDYSLLRMIKLSDRITRSEISSILKSIRTSRQKTRFVSMLSDRKVIAIGEWPEDFSLSSRTDPSTTQLAKLEEKWLGLDR